MPLEFDASTHAYRLDGEPVPSVTQVLSGLEPLDRVPDHLLEAARRFGQNVHAACHLLVRNELDWARLDLDLVPYVEGARRFLTESGITVIASEHQVASRRLRVAGTIDLVGTVRNIEGVYDWKSTATLPRTVGPQTAAYAELYREEHPGSKIQRRFCVLLKPNDYRLVPLIDPGDLYTFRAALHIHRFKHAA